MMQQQKRSATGGPVVYFKGSEICYYNEERKAVGYKYARFYPEYGKSR